MGVLDNRFSFQRLLRPMSKVPEQFVGVTAVTKANVYFNGSVVSHAIIFPDGGKKTLGLIYAGYFHFITEAPERMEIVSGYCKVKLDGSEKTQMYAAGEAFDVPGKSGFSIEVEKD